MKIKRIIIICASLLIAFSVFQMISAQSLAENEWYIKSKEYLAKAEERLIEEIPEWRDMDRGKREIGEIHGYLVDEYAIPREYLAGMTEGCWRNCQI